MRQGRRIKNTAQPGQTVVKVLVTVLVLVACAAALIWWATSRNPAPPPLSAAERSAGIHRMQPPGDSGVDPVDLGAETEVTNVWVTRIEADGRTDLAITTPQGRDQVSLLKGEVATRLGVTLKLIDVHNPGGRGAYAEVQIKP